MTYIERIPVLPGRGGLGRHRFYDPRTAAYPYRPPAGGPALVSIRHTRHIGILNQGQTSACTGNMLVGAAATSPLWDALPAAQQIPTNLSEKLAQSVYSDAERIDGGAGLPTEDAGSTGQSVCKAAVPRGLISGYQWATDLPAALTALTLGPAGFGINWYTSFDDPPASGILELPATATIRGGHEICADQIDVANELVWFANSWGVTYGIEGRAALPFTVLERLLAEDGDCVVPLPVTAPAPVPVPVPVGAVRPDTADLALRTQQQAWQAYRTAGSARPDAADTALRKAQQTWAAHRHLT